MSDEKEDKEQPGTGKHIADLRRKGNVMRSKDLTGGMIFYAGIITLLYMSDTIKECIESNYILCFTSMKAVISDPNFMPIFVGKIVSKNVHLMFPIFIAVFIVTLLSPFLFGGWNFSLEVLQFKMLKLNPLANIKSLFSFKKTATELAKSVLKASVIIGALVNFIMQNKHALSGLPDLSLSASMAIGYQLIIQFVVIISVIIMLLIAVDVIIHYFQFQETTKMSSKEIKDEAKDAEGNSQVKGKIRARQIAMIKQRLSKTVPKANVIITNPTHYAVALRYESDKDRAPVVVAKGKDLIAQQIRLLAIANAIPIYEAPVLARAIFHSTKINAEIHAELYMAVAIVLSYVHQLKNYQMGMGQLPNHVRDLEVPKEFIYDE